MPLGAFVADAYAAWINASRPGTAANTLEKLNRYFRTWYPEPLSSIAVERIESWKSRRLRAGRSASTVLRDLFTLFSVLRRSKGGRANRKSRAIFQCANLIKVGPNAKNRRPRRK